jgi:hypothetical protein
LIVPFSFIRPSAVAEGADIHESAIRRVAAAAVRLWIRAPE